MKVCTFAAALFIAAINPAPVFAQTNPYQIGPLNVVIQQAVSRGGFNLAVGSKVTLQYPNGDTSDADFLGTLAQPDGVDSQFVFLDEKKSEVLYVNHQFVKMESMNPQVVLQQYDQVGGTCTGYALDHFWFQMHLANYKGNGVLADTLSTEKGRTQLLVDAINQYYLVTQHRSSINGIMNQYGKQFGFTCKKEMFTDSDKAVAYVTDRVNAARPVLVAFNVGVNMATSYAAKDDDHTTGFLDDNRIWLPRKTGDRNSGGHSIVVISSFQVGSNQKFLVLDSDWAVPRIWDVSEALVNHVAIQEIEFYSCDSATLK